MTIKNRLNEHIKEALRAKDKNLLTTLRLITAAIKQIEVDERCEVSEERCVAVLTKMTKQRRESIAQYETASRTDLVEQEEFELNVIAQYLPEQLSNTEIEAIVREAVAETGATVAADMGRVMAQVKPKLQGRADMEQVSALVKTLLS